MDPTDNKVTPLGPYRQARLIAKMIDEMAKTPLSKRTKMMSIPACQDPERLRECMAEVCKIDRMAPDYLKWPNDLTGDMRIWLEIFNGKGFDTGFERAFYFWMHRTDFCTPLRSTPYGAQDAAEEADVKDVLGRSALFALTGKLIWDALGSLTPAVDFVFARFFPVFIPRQGFETPKEIIL